jgi:hypothetical protein
LPSYLVIAATGSQPERRFEYSSVEPLGHDFVFSDDGSSYRVWRLVADDSGRYDGLVEAEALVATENGDSGAASAAGDRVLD